MATEDDSVRQQHSGGTSVQYGYDQDATGHPPITTSIKRKLNTNKAVLLRVGQPDFYPNPQRSDPSPARRTFPTPEHLLKPDGIST